MQYITYFFDKTLFKNIFGQYFKTICHLCSNLCTVLCTKLTIMALVNSTWPALVQSRKPMLQLQQFGTIGPILAPRYNRTWVIDYLYSNKTHSQLQSKTRCSGVTYWYTRTRTCVIHAILV